MEQRAPAERKVRVIPRSLGREGEAFRSISTSTGRIRGKRLAEMLGTLCSRCHAAGPNFHFRLFSNGRSRRNTRLPPFKISTLSLRSFEREERGQRGGGLIESIPRNPDEDRD